jgi:hypothetical protein
MVRVLGGSREKDAALPAGINGMTAAVEDDCSALFTSWMVSTQQGLPVRRLRFTLCHELGHLLLRTQGITIRHEERWCNAFAEELLMPRAEIVRRYSNSDPSTAVIQNLSDRALVSFSAALVRLNSALNWNGGLVMFGKVGDSLCVTGMLCMPRRAHYKLWPTRDTLLRLESCMTGSREWLRFVYFGEQIEINCQLVRAGRSRLVLLDACDLAEVCEEIALEGPSYA